MCVCVCVFVCVCMCDERDSPHAVLHVPFHSLQLVPAKPRFDSKLHWQARESPPWQVAGLLDL